MSIALYCLFSECIFSQRRHYNRFRGASIKVYIALVWSSAIGGIVGIGYLVYAGVTLAWWIPFMIVAIGFAFKLTLGFLLSAMIGEEIVSIGGFVVWPACAIGMFMTLPHGL